MRKTVTFASCLVVLFSLGGSRAWAQVGSEEILRELASLRAEVGQLRRELDALKGGGPAPRAVDQPAVDTQLELLKTQVSELAQTKVESTSRFPLKVFGTIHTHAFFNTDNPNWLDIPNLAGPSVADSGTFSATLRQTRIGFTADGPTIGSLRTSGVVALDFFGGIPGFATGQVMGLPRLLVAFARVQGDQTAVQVGQDHMLLAPRDPTSLSGFAFPLLFRSGNLYLRAPHVRVEHSFSPMARIAGGIIAPIAGDVAGEDYRFVPPALGGERSQRPAFQARLEFGASDAEAPRRANVGLGGHYGWERRPAGLVESWGTAVDFGVRRDVIGFAGEFFVGSNIDMFGGALGLDARAAGGWAELQLTPSERVSFNAGGGMDEIRDGQRVLLPRRRNRSAYGNVVFSLTPEVQASFEYRWLGTMVGLASERKNHHVDWVLAYKF